MGNGTFIIESNSEEKTGVIADIEVRQDYIVKIDLTFQANTYNCQY